MKIKLKPLRSLRLCGKKICGFSLVELMVVVAVIAVLIMILIPVLQSARARARSTNCRNNLRQYGIAMGQYMSDWKGYFIYPGSGGGAQAGYDDGSWIYNQFERGLRRRKTIGSSARQSPNNFFSAYIPSMQNRLARMLPGISSVRMCPSVQYELKRGNYFDPNASNYFKGFHTVQSKTFGEYEQADFEHTYDVNDDLLLSSSFTTYAINSRICQWNRQDLSPNTVAFIDWNAKESWGGYITYTNWMFNNDSKGIVQGTPKCAASNNWWSTEVGFHHKDGTNLYANYVAIDGHVASVSSNEINLSYFLSTGPE